MRNIFRILLLLAASSAFAADNAVVVTPGSGVTMRSTDVGSGVQAMQPIISDSTGTAFGTLTNPLSATSLSSASITNPTSTLTRPANTTAYAPNELIASNVTAGSVVVPSFAIATSGGATILSRIRLRTSAASGWDGVTISVNLWTASAPTYTNGDNGAYVVATGASSWIGSFLITLTQFGDGAVGASQLTGANEMAIKLASGTTVYWDMQIMGAATPISGQTFTLTAELMN